jgi:phosphomannomutase
VLDIVRADGVKFLFADDAWLLLRPSGTEPLVRIYAEAPTDQLVADLIDEGRALVTGSR